MCPHRELAKDLDHIVVGDGDGRALCLEIEPIQEQGSIPSHGLLLGRCQRGGRDSKAQHGPHPLASLSKHVDLASFH